MLPKRLLTITIHWDVKKIDVQKILTDTVPKNVNKFE
jgi:hypothetical protein